MTPITNRSNNIPAAQDLLLEFCTGPARTPLPSSASNNNENAPTQTLTQTPTQAHQAPTVTRDGMDTTVFCWRRSTTAPVVQVPRQTLPTPSFPSFGFTALYFKTSTLNSSLLPPHLLPSPPAHPMKNVVQNQPSMYCSDGSKLFGGGRTYVAGWLVACRGGVLVTPGVTQPSSKVAPCLASAPSKELLLNQGWNQTKLPVAPTLAVALHVVGKSERRGRRSKDRFGGRVTWWMLVASFFLAVLGGMAGVGGVPIPACTYTDRSYGSFSVPQVTAGGVGTLESLPNDGQAVAQQTQKGEIDRLFDYRSQELGALQSSEDHCTPRDINILDSRDGNNALPCYACKNRQGSSAQNCDHIELDHVDGCTVVAVFSVFVAFQPASGYRGDGGAPNNMSGNGKIIFTPIYIIPFFSF